MALKFLNKKGWHTGSLRNIETVWKAEQKHEGEQKKLEELRKQIQDEREKSEFRLMQEQAGLVPKQERLEFLYDSGLQVGKVAQADEYLLGKPVEEAAQPENDVGQVAAKPGALFVEEKPASANDSWRKLHSDPLFLIKQQEQAAIARITSNPVKMAGIKKAAEMKKKLKEEKKRKRKEAKRERREKKKRKKHHASSSEEDSSDSDESPKRRKHRHDSDADDDHKYRRAQAKFSRSPTRSPVHKDQGEERQYEKRKSPSRSPVLRDNDRGRSRRDGYDSRGASKLEGRQREHRGNDKGFEGRESERRKRSLSRSASKSPVPRDRDQRLNGSDGRGSEKRMWIPSRSPLRSRSRSPVRSSVVRRDHDQSGARRDEFDSRGRQREYKVSDERLKRPEDRDYGMRGRSPPRRPSRSPGRRSYGLNRPRRDDLDYRDELRHREHTSVDQRLKEPVDEDSRPRDSRELERGSKSANNGVAASNDMNGLPSRQGHKGRPPKPGHQQLSDAERAARLAEMQANADVHEEQRWQRLKRAADADVVEAKRTEKDKSNEQFLADTQKSFFGAEKGNASTIEKSVKRRAHFVERSSGDNERNAFRR